MRAAIYTRISKDREGAGLGVERQEMECQALAERLGWAVVATFTDNDISAASGKPRPGYRAMLDAIGAGRVDAVIAWHTDRLHRRPIELEEFISLAEERSLAVQTVKAGDLNLSTASGRMVARMLGAAARAEVDNTRDRIRSQKAKAAERGEYRGGPRPFGYEADGVTIREPEAAIVRDATAAVLAGRTLAAIARDLNASTSIRPTKRPDWDYQAVRDLVIRPRNAAVIHHGRPGREGFAEVGPAAWPRIVSEEQWRAAYALLTEPSRRQQRGTRMRWLGSNIYLCGLCGSPMKAAPHSQSKRHHYRCTDQAHLSIAVGPTDRYVAGVVAELLRDPRVVAAMTEPDPHLEEWRAARVNATARLARFEADYESGLIDGVRFARLTAKAEADLIDLDERIAASVQRAQSSDVLAARDPGLAFLEAPLDVQRAVLRALLIVTIEPAAKRGAHWSSDRIRLDRPTPPHEEAASA
jgi:DNA invertase Pin-like site-specific DNA recombinase